MTIEKRTATAPVALEVRKDDVGTEKNFITGYASVFYNGKPETEFRLANDFVERVSPKAFDGVIDRDDVRALFNHDSNYVLGRSKSGTLKMSVDKRGLKYEIEIPDTSAGRDLMTSIKRGDITGSSFSFTVDKESYEEKDAVTVRTVEAVTLYDVGPVTYPAYAGTEAQARNAAPAFEMRAQIKQEKEAENNKIKARQRLTEIETRLKELEL